MTESGLIYVSRPVAPDTEQFASYIESIVKTRRFTNGGPFEAALRLRLMEILRVPYLDLVCNGTIALQVAAKSLGMEKRVVCTPFTFVATVSSLLWMGIKPVLVDVEDEYLTIDPDQVEMQASKDISGIVGVHVYGNPCDVERLSFVSKRHDVPILYDAAHVFDQTLDGVPLLAFGDASATSFHATKLFNTCEGGAVITGRSEVAAQVSRHKNFGIASEDVIQELGINAKMSELSAAFGLSVLDQIAAEKSSRREIIKIYDRAFANQDLFRVLGTRSGLNERLQYYVVRIPQNYRDAVYLGLREKGIYARRYFFPLLSDVPAVARLCELTDCPVARRAANEVLVLPLHSGLTAEDAARISKSLIDLAHVSRRS